jgi:mRNA interferase MazF
MRRGDLYWAEMVQDDGLSKRRPVLVVQADRFNRSRIGTVLIVPITSNTEATEYPGNVFLPAGVVNLPKDSVAVGTGVRAIRRERMDERIGSVPAYLVEDVDRGMRLALGL